MLQGHEKDTLTLSRLDKRLLVDFFIEKPIQGNFKTISKWVYSSLRLVLGTTEDELLVVKDFFIFKKIRICDIMEAYALLYRLRWIKYDKGNPIYELTLGADRIDDLFIPQNEYQKRRFQSINSFVDQFEKFDSSKKREILSGGALNYSDLPDGMKNSIKSAVSALLDADKASNIKKEFLDVNNLSDVTIRIQDRTKMGSNIKELAFSVNSNSGGYSFRWNNYDKDKSKITYGRPVEAILDITKNENFSRDRMIKKSKLLNSVYIDLENGKLDIKRIMILVSDKYGLKIIMNETNTYDKKEFSSNHVVLWKFLDNVCQDFGGWEWEISSSEVIILREKENPRKRLL
ncbi:hypothetical protein [Armatimonas sp.]|uniref:hypothetical protein n=1 Tax=Armatimonas sp. TaxID=1872638 RepID=UPI003751F52C